MTRPRPLILAAAVVPLALVGLGVRSHPAPAPILVNESPSLPEGLYRRISTSVPERGAIVAIAQPASVRAHLRRQGMPAEVRLLKRVAATGGDLVCSDGQWLMAPMRTEPIHARGRDGQPLPAWTGCRRLEPDERFLLGDTPTSLDSRYFGPVSIAGIEGVYREVWTW